MMSKERREKDVVVLLDGIEGAIRLFLDKTKKRMGEKTLRGHVLALDEGDTRDAFYKSTLNFVQHVDQKISSLRFDKILIERDKHEDSGCTTPFYGTKFNHREELTGDW